MKEGYKIMSRTTSFVLGLIGGILGFFFALLAFVFLGIGTAFGAENVTGLGISAIFASLVGIVGAVIVKYHHKLGGWIMILSAIWGTISISVGYILPGLLLLLGGIIGLKKETKK